MPHQKRSFIDGDKNKCSESSKVVSFEEMNHHFVRLGIE